MARITTEADWLSSTSPEDMLALLGGRASERKLRYFVVACARRVLPDAADAAMTRALAVAERYADGAESRYALARARVELADDHPARVGDWFPLYTSHIRSVPAWHALREKMAGHAGLASRVCAWASTRRGEVGRVSMTYPDGELTAQAALVRDIFGNPFCPVTFEPAWRTPTIAALARGLYDSRDFSAMPVLADALEEAGCCNPMVLGHCRGDGPRVRGDWVVDLVLGKE